MISKISARDIRGAKTCGSGSYGVVRVIEFPSKGKVALKQLRIAGGGDDDDLCRRALREGDMWRRLKHPNVLPFLGIIESTTDLYLISLYAKNGTLKEYIARHSDANRERLVWEAAIAIAFLHERGIIHGDIKSLNILVSDEVHALICDFGLTRPQTDATSIGLQGVGTIRYQSPELLTRGGGKTLESDVWAFGMTIYEALSGVAPFDGLGVPAMIHAIVMEDKLPPTVPLHSASGISYARIWNVAKGCWQKDPTRRPSMKLVSRQLRPHVLQMKGRKQSVSCLAFARDGHTVVSGSIDCTLRLWDVESSSPKGEGLEGHMKLVSCLAFSPDGTTVVSGSYDHTLRLWDVGSSSRKGRVLEGHSDWVRCLGFSPDGRSIASGCSVWPSRRTATPLRRDHPTTPYACGMCVPQANQAKS